MAPEWELECTVGLAVHRRKAQVLAMESDLESLEEMELALELEMVEMELALEFEMAEMELALEFEMAEMELAPGFSFW